MSITVNRPALLERYLNIPPGLITNPAVSLARWNDVLKMAVGKKIAVVSRRGDISFCLPQDAKSVRAVVVERSQGEDVFLIDANYEKQRIAELKNEILTRLCVEDSITNLMGALAALTQNPPPDKNIITTPARHLH